ncbi:MAG: putative PEP-binding protein, partial [Desulfofundulus sp.]
LHPAILRLVKNVIDVARNNRKKVAMCGEMAGEPLATMLLLGLGLDQFSAAAGSLPEIKKVIRAVTLKEAREVALQALQLSAPEEVRRFLEQEMKSRRLYFSSIWLQWLRISVFGKWRSFVETSGECQPGFIPAGSPGGSGASGGTLRDQPPGYRRGF